MDDQPPAGQQPAVPGGYMPRASNDVAPFQWAWLGVALSLVYAVASAIGGFVLAGDHKHAVKVSNSFGLGPSIEQQNDNNYIALGFVAAGAWVHARPR